MKKHRHIYFVIFFCFILFCIPFFSAPGYNIGGDHSLLYYLYPKEYLRNYLFFMGTGNVLGGVTGYTQNVFAVPLIGLILFVKTILPTINTQNIFYGANLSLGFLFTFLFFRILDKTKNTLTILAAILAACLYITNPYLGKTLFQSKLIGVYLVTLVPLLFYMITRGLEQKNMKFIVGGALLYVLFSSSLLSFPWFGPLLIVSIPYVFYCALKYRRFFWKSIIVFTVVSIGLHWYWLVHIFGFVISSRFDRTLASVVDTAQFIRNAQNDMFSTVFLNGPMHQIAGYLRSSWQDHSPMQSSNLIGSIPLVLVMIAGITLKKMHAHLRILFVVALSSLCIALFLVTPNMGKWNMDFFLFLNRTIPFFSMFRNMYDKFGLAMAFTSAFAVFVSLVILFKQKHNIWKWIAIGLGAFLFIYQIPSFLTIQGIGSTTSNMTELSREYFQLTQAITLMNTTKRFVWYPMTFPSYSIIQDDKNKNSWYLGLSPLQAFTDASDISGFYELQTDADPYRNWKILELFKQKRFEEIVATLASYNVGYVITINNALPDEVWKQLDFFSFMSAQTDEYKNSLLGEKLYDFGEAYSIYRINPKYSFDTAFLTDNPQDINAPKEKITISRKNIYVYEVTISPEFSLNSLILLTPYHVLWKVTVPKTAEDKISLGNHRRAYAFGNVWDIKKINNFSGPVTITIEFIPNRFIIPSVAVSILVCIGCILYIWYPKKKI